MRKELVKVSLSKFRETLRRMKEFLQKGGTREDLGLPIFVWGMPGIGKTKSIYEVFGDKARVIIASLYDRDEIKGIPVVVKKGEEETVKYVPLSQLPREGWGVIFLDELNTSKSFELWLRFTLEGRIEEYELPPSWAIIAAGNLPEHNEDSILLSAPLANRFVHIWLEPTAEEIENYFLSKGLELGAAFVRRFGFYGEISNFAYLTPRTLEDALRKMDMGLDFLVEGIIGSEYASYLRVLKEAMKEIPEVEDYLSGEKGFPKSSDAALLFSLSLVNYSRTEEKLEKVLLRLTGDSEVPKELLYLILSKVKELNFELLVKVVMSNKTLKEQLSEFVRRYLK